MKKNNNKVKTVNCPTCSGQGWINTHEQCPVCRGQGVLPVMPAAQKQQQSQQQTAKCPTCRGAGRIGNEQCPVCRGNGYLPVMPEPKKYPVIQQPEQQTTVYPERQVNDLHIFFHAGAMEYQQAGTMPDTQRAAAAMPVSGSETAKGISIFQLCCIAAVIFALLTWGGAL